MKNMQIDGLKFDRNLLNVLGMASFVGFLAFGISAQNLAASVSYGILTFLISAIVLFINKRIKKIER